MAKKKKSTVAATRRRLAAKTPPAKASDYLTSLAKYHKQHPDMRVVRYCRVSTGPQYSNGGADAQKKTLRHYLNKRDIPIMATFSIDCSGSIEADRKVLRQAAIIKARLTDSCPLTSAKSTS